MPGPKRSELDRAVLRGLSFLAKHQEADGSFLSFSSSSFKPFRRTRSWRTVFVPALMLTSLANLDRTEALSIKVGLTNFLLSQKSDDWSFNYWSKNAPEYAGQPYPDDLDDTFCALAALYSHDPSLIGADVMARIVKLLLATETEVGGPYRTWLASENSPPVWLDVDIAVNSNIAFFLSLTGNSLPRLDEFMGRSISDGSFSSPYYPNDYAFLYYFARAYEGSHKGDLIQRVRRSQRLAETELDKALCICARLKLGDTRGLDIGINDLLSTQRRDGSWPVATFYADPVIAGKPYYNGAAALTTAFALEVLQLYSDHKSSRRATSPLNSKDDKNLKRLVLAVAKEQCRNLGDDLRDNTLLSLKKIATGSNGDEIIGLARNFRKSLIAPPKSLPEEFMVKLGLANLYGWLAYTIYDDFLDGEGKQELVSVANVSMRRSLGNFFDALPENEPFAVFVRQIFDIIDGANAWEVANCRFGLEAGKLQIGRLPDYGDLEKLADRSLGHALAPMAVLAAAGKDPDDRASRKILQAFRHYLIARQLNDDAHDWEEDLSKGRVTPVVAMILEGLGVRTGKHDVTELSAASRRYFWHAVLSEVCELMRRHAQLSREALRTSGLIKSEGIMNELLDGIEVSSRQALDQQRQAKDFLEHYRAPGNKVKG